MTGRVYLVGAGPGDPRLLTLRALELIERADVILYDRLIPDAALDGARADAELLFVGKEGGGPSVPQEQTEALMVARAQAGATAVGWNGPSGTRDNGSNTWTLAGSNTPTSRISGGPPLDCDPACWCPPRDRYWVSVSSMGGASSPDVASSGCQTDTGLRTSTGVRIPRPPRW